MQNFKQFLKVALLPLFIFVFDGGICLIIAQKYSLTFLLPALVSALVVTLLAERLIPYSEDFNRPRGDVGADIWHASVNEGEALLLIICLPFLVRLFSLHLWPQHWPFAAQLLLAVVLFDLGVWLAHSMSHKIDALWRFHAVHHSVERLYGFNGLMKHPLHLAIEQIPGAALLVLAGVPQDVAIALGACTFVQLLMQHANIDFRTPLLGYVLNTSLVHRFHHINDPAMGNCNYGLFTNFWDMVFGTFRFHPDRHFTSKDFGLADRAAYPRDYLGQLMEPFKPAPI